jgi:uncharacterized protein YbjT (DUF2867 family)
MIHRFEARTRCEEMIRESGLNATILRPWYVLGPGHYCDVVAKLGRSMLRPYGLG